MALFRSPHISCFFALSSDDPFLETCIYLGEGHLGPSIAVQKLLEERPVLTLLIIAVKQICKVSRDGESCRPQFAASLK